MSSAAHHAAAEHDSYLPTVSSAQSSDIHADPQLYGSRAEHYDDDGILNDSEPPSRQVAISLFKGVLSLGATNIHNVVHDEEGAEGTAFKWTVRVSTGECTAKAGWCLLMKLGRLPCFTAVQFLMCE